MTTLEEPDWFRLTLSVAHSIAARRNRSRRIAAIVAHVAVACALGAALLILHGSAISPL